MWLWNHLKKEDYAFDDISRGKHEVFLYKLFQAGNETFEFGDHGLFMLEGIVPHVSTIVHHCIWNKEVNFREVVKASRELLDYCFTFHHVNRISTIIPQMNKYAMKMATFMGFKYEGEMRQAWLSGGRYHSLLIYGLLRKEFYSRRGSVN